MAAQEEDEATRTTLPDREDRATAQHTPDTVEASGSGPHSAGDPPRSLATSLKLRERDRYDVLAEHGRGGLGVVSRAHDNELGRHVAIKEMLCRGDAGETRFLREALITARLEHPGIVPIHEAGRWPDGTPFYVMKLVAGSSLKDLIETRKTVSERLRLLPNIIAVTDAMAYAHKRNIIHRDLKPANVIVGDFGETVVIDWGLAKDLSSNEETMLDDTAYRAHISEELTQVGHIIGTPLYMAPEQCRGDAVDQRADVFAIGAMLWELCSLTRVAPNEPALRRKLLRKERIDPDLCAIVENCLEPDANRRYADCATLAKDLRAFETGTRISARQYSLWQMAKHWAQHHKAVSISAALLVVLATVGGAVYVRNISIERTAANVARTRADEERDEARLARDSLLLHNVELLSSRDTVQAQHLLAGYSGNDIATKNRLRAELKGNGLPDTITKISSKPIAFVAHGQADEIIAITTEPAIRSSKTGLITDDLEAAGDDLYHIQYSEEAKTLAYRTTAHHIALLNTQSHQIRRQRFDRIESFSLSKDGSTLVAIDEAGRIRVWETTSGRVLFERQQTGASTIGGHDRRRITIWDSKREALSLIDITEKSQDIRLLPGHQLNRANYRPAWQMTANGVLVGTTDGHIVSLDLQGRILDSLSVCSGYLYILMYASSTVGYSCKDGAVGFARLSSGSLQKIAAFGLGPEPKGVHFDRDGSRAVITGPIETLAYDVEHQIVRHLDVGYHLAQPEFTSEQLLVGGNTGEARIWNLESPRSPRAPRLLVSIFPWAGSLRFDSDDRILAVGGANVIDRVTLESPPHHEQLEGQTEGSIAGTIPSPLEDRFLSFGTQNICIWQAVTGVLLKRISWPTKRAGISWADNSTLVVTDASGVVTLLPIDSDASPRIIYRHSRRLANVVYARRYGRLFAFDASGVMIAVELKQGSSVSLDSGHSSPPATIQMSKDETILAIGYADGRVELRDTASLKVVHASVLEKEPQRLLVDPMNRDVLVIDIAGNLHHWALEGSRMSGLDIDGRKIVDFAISPDDAYLGLRSRDGVWIRTIGTTEWFYFRKHLSDLSAFAFAQHSKTIAIADTAGDIWIEEFGDSVSPVKSGATPLP